MVTAFKASSSEIAWLAPCSWPDGVRRDDMHWTSSSGVTGETGLSEWNDTRHPALIASATATHWLPISDGNSVPSSRSPRSMNWYEAIGVATPSSTARWNWSARAALQCSTRQR